MKKLSFLLVIIFFFCFSQTKVSAYNPSSYIVYDADMNAVLEGKNMNTISLIASTTKIMTAIVAIENGSMLDTYKVSKEDTLVEGSKVYLYENETMTLCDLLYGLLLRSGNDCANMIARCVTNDYDHFIFLMNEKCKEIGMLNSSFENPSGLDTLNENRSTSYDLALLMTYAMKNEIFKEIASSHSHVAYSIEGRRFSWINKDKSILSDDRFIAGKTGV